MLIKADLQHFYDAEAKKYASTRKKHRADADTILQEIKKQTKKTISILEFGCGSGRLIEHLQTLQWIKINYTGVDISGELLKIAAKDAKNHKKSSIIHHTLIHDDITHYIKSCSQESFDFIIGIASFQHIPNTKERNFLIRNFYRIMKYEGKLIMTNRAMSKRFMQKYAAQIMKSLFKYIITLGKHNIRDIMVPRNSSQNTQEKHYRFYHMFSLKELKKLLNAGGFLTQKAEYINKEWKETIWRKNANNSLIIAEKKIFNQ